MVCKTVCRFCKSATPKFHKKTLLSWGFSSNIANFLWRKFDKEF